MIGYRAWFYYAEKKADAAMEVSLDKDQYNERDLVSLTIPLDNPYQLEQKTFERINGEISFQGKTFKYVKRKVIDGNLIILCISDTRKTDLKKGKTEYGSISNDFTGNSRNSSRPGLQKNFSSNDYIDHSYNNMASCQYADFTLMYSTYHVTRFTDPFMSLPGKPPQYRA
jgi:hypothetical protein